ncbi:MAG: hypothetical protein ACI4QT_10630 [Kiritimatiellia bacterium]
MTAYPFTFILFLAWILLASHYHPDGKQDYWLQQLRFCQEWLQTPATPATGENQPAWKRFFSKQTLQAIPANFFPQILFLLLLLLFSLISNAKTLYLPNVVSDLQYRAGSSCIVFYIGSLLYLLAQFSLIRTAILLRINTRPAQREDFDAPLPLLNTALWPLNHISGYEKAKTAAFISAGLFFLAGLVLVPVTSIANSSTLARFVAICLGGVVDTLLIALYLFIAFSVLAFLLKQRKNFSAGLMADRYVYALSTVILPNAKINPIQGAFAGLYASILLWFSHSILGSIAAFLFRAIV